MTRENLNDLAAFLAVARLRNFTRAAAQLGVSQSALSRTVQALEQRIGVMLLSRTTRSVSPTEAGERLLATLAPKLDEIELELDELRAARSRPAGNVRITAIDFAANLYVWPKLRRLLGEYPEIRIELINDYGLANIVEQRYDLGIRLGDQVEKDMIATRISPDITLAIVGAPFHLGRARPIKAPEDLTQHNCINLWLPTQEALMPWELRRGRRHLKVRVSGQLVFNNAYQMVNAALEGFGLAYVPRELVEEHVKNGRLEWVLEDWHPTFTGFHVYYSSRRQSSRAVALVLEALKS